MNDILLKIIDKYLLIYPDEKLRQEQLINFLNMYDKFELFDWNNFDGHITVGGFIYDKSNSSILLLHHNDLKMYLYPGGHVDIKDKTLIDAVVREISEETGLLNLNFLKICDDELVPFDIDTHLIQYNDRLNLPEHYHFDFRYLFVVDKISDIVIDSEECSDYSWLSIDELVGDLNYKNVVLKINKIIN